MSVVILITALAFILFFLFRKNNSYDTQYGSNTGINSTQYISSSHKSYLYDEDGKKYYETHSIKKSSKRLFIHGNLKGKYHGELDKAKEEEFLNSKLFNFTIYESYVDTIETTECNCIADTKHLCSGIHTEQEGKFHLNLSELGDNIIDFNKPIPAIISINSLDKKFNVSISDAQLKNIKLDTKLHQTENHEIYGTLTCEVSGYILQEEEEPYIDRIYVDGIVSTTGANIPTGASAGSGGSSYGNYKPTYVNDGDCCLSSIFSGLFWLLGIIFLILAIPTLISLWPLVLLFLLYYFFRDNAGCIVPILLLIFAGIFLFSLFTNPLHKRYVYPPKEEQQIKKDYIPITDTIRSTDSTIADTILQDTLIMHYQTWKDYSGNIFEGRFWVKQRDYQNAHQNKNILEINGNDDFDAYNRMLYSLKEFDNNKLQGIYYMFDSLKQANNFDTIQFANVIVSFVQNIPYVLILPFDCDPALCQNDAFAVRYLSRSDARCSGNQRFGINTPVEFMANLNADCDSRTLFLYTVLSHYGYDVALMNSEYYNHSIIGINLPLNGLTYDYNDQHYVLWETTDKGWQPGALGPENNDINKWRISLKSK